MGTVTLPASPPLGGGSPPTSLPRGTLLRTFQRSVKMCSHALEFGFGLGAMGPQEDLGRGQSWSGFRFQKVPPDALGQKEPGAVGGAWPRRQRGRRAGPGLCAGRGTDGEIGDRAGSCWTPARGALAQNALKTTHRHPLRGPTSWNGNSSSVTNDTRGFSGQRHHRGFPASAPSSPDTVVGRARR